MCKTRLLSIVVLSVAFGQIVAFAQTAEDLVRYQENNWYKSMSDAYGERFRGEFESAIATFNEALSLSPSDDHAANAILGIAEAYESQFKRDAAITAYKRVVNEYPLSHLVPQACVRLAALYTSITLLPAEASSEEKEAVRADMSAGEATEYLEKGASAPTSIPGVEELDSAVLSCKLALAIRYFDMRKTDSAIQLLDQIMRLQTSDVHKPSSERPYAVRNTPVVLPIRLDKARLAVAGARRGAQEIRIELAVVQLDPKKSIENLQKLAETHGDSDFVALVNERINSLQSQLVTNQTNQLDSISENVLGIAIDTDSSR